ncbi:unnamed protein product [Ilex paraguariensis]|uniref:NAC domain-containing protein n=1 Tax=Ilex paraguariensis TaxID=185542 RepID=A0ABC8URU6_9AQUA
MDERNDDDKMDETMLPGFRFHPTDEELVGFYLKRKIQQLPLSIEIIKQVDLYKYDPWDLPKLATTGEKEWYFYCPRDRKYRNSARPNRVTGAGFWKATGTDRPIYSVESSKCIGLKKSLVFYKGRAAKGIKTDWMMHEFRLPPIAASSAPPKRFTDKNIPTNASFPCKGRPPASCYTTLISPEALEPHKCSGDASSLLLNMPSSMFGGFGKASETNESIAYSGLQQQWKGFSSTLAPEMQGNLGPGEESSINDTNLMEFGDQWETMRSGGFPFSLPFSMPYEWKSNLLWYPSPCPTEMSSNYSTNRGYT